MKTLLALLIGATLLGVAAQSEAKVCYRCTEYRPVRFVCANRDTFANRRRARKICNWKSYSSRCHCWKWVKPARRDFARHAIWQLRQLRR